MPTSTDQYGKKIDNFYGAPITLDDLAPGSVLDIKVPQETGVPDVSSLGFTQITPTTEEGKATDLSTRLQELNKQLVGESVLRTQKEEVQGIPEQRKAFQDLSGQLAQLQAEAKAIPIQLQQLAEGRGITVGGLAPIERGRLRENAIKALTVSSTLEATRGNLALAYDLVDRAVKAKYDPIREEINALTSNLDLIIKSPEYSRQEKNRAEAQKAIQEKRKEDLKREEEDRKNIYTLAVKAAENGADALTIRNMQNATNSEEAIVAAGGFLQKPEEDKLLSVSEAKALGVPFGTTVKQAQARGIIPGGGDGEIETIENKLIQSRGSDGFVNPIIYQNEKSKAKINSDEFDKRFSYLLSPQERKNLGKESVVDIRKRKEDLSNLLGQVASYTTREEALNELNRYQSSIFEKVGQEGLDKLKVEVDRLFPEKKEEEIKKEEEKIGETTGLFGSFFRRLFGK